MIYCAIDPAIMATVVGRKKTQNGTNLDLEDDDITDELLPKPRLKKHFKG